MGTITLTGSSDWLPTVKLPSWPAALRPQHFAPAFFGHGAGMRAARSDGVNAAGEPAYLHRASDTTRSSQRQAAHSGSVPST